MQQFKEEDVKYFVDLVSRKTIHDFNELDREEARNSHKVNIINNLSDEERLKNSYLFNQDSLDEEVKNFGLAKGFVYLDNDKYKVDTELESEELKELYKDLKMYEYSIEQGINQDKNLDIEYLKKEKIFNNITKDDFYSAYDIEKIKSKAEDELYYPDLKNEVDKEIDIVRNEFKNESDNHKKYLNSKIDDVYYSIYETKDNYSKKYNIDINDIDYLHDKYNLPHVLNNIEQVKLNQNPELDISIDKHIQKNSKEYEKYIEKYYDTKNDYDFSLAGTALANKNLYSNMYEHLKDNDINKDLKEKENIKRFSAKDNEKINRIKQDELYRKLIKQMSKNEKFLNSTKSNIAYKSRANSENLSLSSAQLSSRDSMQTQSQIDRTESKVRNTIQDTKTDNRIHRRKEDKDNHLER